MREIAWAEIIHQHLAGLLHLAVLLVDSSPVRACLHLDLKSRRVSSGDLWSMQRRLNDCFRQQRFPFPGYASDVTVALGVYMGVNAKGAESIAPALKR